MLWIRSGFLSSLILFNSVLAVVTLKVSSNAVLGTPLDVVWKRDRGDTRIFDLHKFLDGEDYGFIAHVEADRGQTTGHITVNFDETGDFTIRAFDFEESQQPLAETPNHINVRPFGEVPNSSDPADPTSTSASEGMSSATLPATGSTATATTSSSSSTGPTVSPSQTPSSASSKPPPKINAAAIAGAVIGGIVVFALLVLGTILLIRRRRACKESNKRFTFHRDLMVQARPTGVSHLTSTLAEGGERSPRIPRFSFQRLSRRDPAAPSAAPLAHGFTPAHAGPTDRQLQLNARVRQLEEMMHEIRYRPGMSRVLEQLRSQVSWLRAQRNSPWALHETDERPQHYDLYMTS